MARGSNSSSINTSSFLLGRLPSWRPFTQDLARQDIQHVYIYYHHIDIPGFRLFNQVQITFLCPSLIIIYRCYHYSVGNFMHRWWIKVIAPKSFRVGLPNTRGKLICYPLLKILWSSKIPGMVLPFPCPMLSFPLGWCYLQWNHIRGW